MKILHVVPSIDPSYGGPAEGVRHYCNIYAAGGHQAEIASLDSPDVVNHLDFPATVTGLGPGSGTYGYTSRAILWLKANIARFDLVVIDGIWSYNTVAAYRALAGTGIPYVVFTHGMLDPYFKRRYPLKHLKKTIYWQLILRKIMCEATTVFFTCEEEKILARQSFSGYKVHETLVPYGTFGPTCDIAAAAEEFLARWPHLRGKRLALSLSRIHPKKATDILIEAYATTLAKNPDWHLVIAGPDQIGWQRELEALAARLGIADRITWTGMLKGTLKWGAFAASEVFVLPSHQENFGIVVAEALACGLPVVISTKVNIWREISSYWAGLIGDDTLDGTKAVLSRWSELTPDETAAVRIRAKKCFDALFNFETTSQKVLAIVEQLASAKAQTVFPAPPKHSSSQPE